MGLYYNKLYHYGIPGQKWGKRNGPPYPLDANDKSYSEKKAAKYNKKTGLTDRQKRYIKYGAIAAGGILAAAGTAYLIKSGKFNELSDIGKQYLESQFASGTISNIGKAYNDINKTMVSNINKTNYNTVGGRTNCAHTTTAYILNSMFGKNVTALPYNGIDEVSGMVIPYGRDFKVFSSIFEGLNIRECSLKETMKDTFDSLNPGSTGILMIGRNGAGHFVNYEKTKTGITTIIDPQIDSILDSKYYENMGFSPWRVLDFSNASISKDAEKALKHMVGGY